LVAGKRSGPTDEARVLALFPAGASNATLSQAARTFAFSSASATACSPGFGRWEGYIRRAFAARGMPEELAVL